jgi:hypothetical protein
MSTTTHRSAGARRGLVSRAMGRLAWVASILPRAPAPAAAAAVAVVAIVVAVTLHFLHVLGMMPSMPQRLMSVGSGSGPKPGHAEYCVIGAGPGGLQVGSLLHEAGLHVVVFDKARNAGSFFARFPVHRRLISINKRRGGCKLCTQLTQTARRQSELARAWFGSLTSYAGCPPKGRSRQSGFKLSTLWKLKRDYPVSGVAFTC